MSNKKLLLSVLAISTLYMGGAYANAYVWNAPVISDPNPYKEILAPTTTPTNQQGLSGNPLWQMLGDSWGENDGVTWSINGGAFSNTDFDMNVGDNVQFKFDMYKTLWGTHSYDAIKVWLDDDVLDLYDFDQAKANNIGAADSIWAFNKDKLTEDAGRFENEISYYHNYSALDYDDNGTSVAPLVKDANWDRYYAGQSKYFVSNVIRVNESGSFNLVARVTCSDDLGGSAFGHYPDMPTQQYWDNFQKDNYYWQGEKEQYAFNVESVPEPASMSLLGLGLLSIALFRRKRAK